MAEKIMTTDEITDAMALGAISAAEALDQLIFNGMSEEDARYLLRSMADVDVRG
jgi:hypothetical protein